MIREVFAACMRISDGVCPEAYNLLALRTARTHQESLMLYLKAEELCSYLCDDFEELCRYDTMRARVATNSCVHSGGRLSQQAPHLHCYLRAVHGAANCYRKMGRLRNAMAMCDAHAVHAES